MTLIFLLVWCLFELAKEIYREQLPVHTGKMTPSPMLERQWHTLVCPQVLSLKCTPKPLCRLAV